jgi:hypothetical protein
MPAAPNGYRPDSDTTGAYAAGAYGTGAYGAGPRYAGAPGSGPQPTLGTASGPQPTYGARSGPQSVLGPGSGPLRALDRDPARGFPPRGSQQEHAADSWYSPAGGYPAAGSYSAGAYSPPPPPPAPPQPAPPQPGPPQPAPAQFAPPQPAPPPQQVPAPPPPPPDSYATGGFSPPTGSYATGAFSPPADSYATGAFSPSASDYATEAFSVPADGYAQDYRPNQPQYDYQPDDDSAAWPPLDSAPEPWSEPPRRGLFRRPAVIGAVAVLVVAALGAGGYYKFVYAPHSATVAADNSLKLPTTDSTAGNPYFSKKLGPYQHIDTRKLDPVPLSLDELYLPAFTISGNEYVKATANLTKTCGDAVFGELIQAALQAGGCTQVARATYVSGDGKIMGTIGVANLSSTYWAGKAAKTVGSTELVAPLTSAKGPTKNLLKGTGLAYAAVKGHYLILFYAEFASTKTPSTAAEKQELVAFCNGMFSGSADIALSHRMLYGKPEPSAT